MLLCIALRSNVLLKEKSARYIQILMVPGI